MNDFNEYVRDSFSEYGEIVIRSMMGGYLVYFNGKLIGDICDNELFLKRTPTSDRLLADSELRTGSIIDTRNNTGFSVISNERRDIVIIDRCERLIEITISYVFTFFT